MIPIKKAAAVLLSGAMLLSAAPAVLAAETGRLIGDADTSGEVNTIDATAVQRYVAEMQTEPFDTVAADVNRDNAVDVIDVTIIQRYLAEYIPDFDAWAPVVPKELTLSDTELMLDIGERFALTTSYTEEDGAVGFVSNDPNVAVADENGEITAVGAGTAVVTATASNGMTAACTVTVWNAPQKLGVNLPTPSLGVGETCTLHALYDGSRVGFGATFVSDNPAVLSVDPVTGELVAKSVGYATVTVTSYNGLTAKCYVSVKNAPTRVAFSNKNVNMLTGESVQFYLHTLNRDEALFHASYTTDNEAVVSVTEGGMVTANSVGTATVTATAYNGMTASVQVNVLASAGTVTKTTTSAVGLRRDSTWKASNIVILPKGTRVTAFGTSTDGRWIKAQYGEHCGWIYNKALGVTTNCTTVTVNTLPAAADDLIFDCNLNTKNIFDFVLHKLAYRSINEQGLEEMAAYALQYRRGACYQRAALMCYLLDRIGYDTIYVSGTVTIYGNTHHKWCLAKTANGWRHFDPTPVTVTEYCNVTDKEMSIFAWDHTKYPAAQ